MILPSGHMKPCTTDVELKLEDAREAHSKMDVQAAELQNEAETVRDAQCAEEADPAPTVAAAGANSNTVQRLQDADTVGVGG